MRWIEQEQEFEKIRLEAKTCVFIDSDRESSSLRKLIFDDAMTCTLAFAGLLQDLMEWSCDIVCNYAVLEPDPVNYFYKHFKRYPAFEIRRGDPAQLYLGFLNEDPGESAADAISTNSWAWVIVPPSMKWFVHVLRSDDDKGGHLWTPADWHDRVRNSYRWTR